MNAIDISDLISAGALSLALVALIISFREHVSNKPKLQVAISYKYPVSATGDIVSSPDIGISVVNKGRQPTTVVSLEHQVVGTERHVSSSDMFRDWGDKVPAKLPPGEILTFVIPEHYTMESNGQTIPLYKAYSQGLLKAAVFHSMSHKPTLAVPKKS